MYTGRLVFSQLMDFLPKHQFRQCVNRYTGNRYMKSFSCLDQFLCMAFAQLCYRESLRDIESCLRAMQNKLYHLGIRAKISRSTLADANEKRDWRIYADFAHMLINTARDLWWRFWSRARWNSICSGLINDWSMPFSFSLGQIQKSKRGDQAPYTIGFKRKHSLIHFYNRW